MTCRSSELPHRYGNKQNRSRIFKVTSAANENLADGATVDDFLEWFPGVTRAQVDSVLEHTAASLETEAVA
jgi:hypothetical protein